MHTYIDYMLTYTFGQARMHTCTVARKYAHAHIHTYMDYMLTYTHSGKHACTHT